MKIHIAAVHEGKNPHKCSKFEYMTSYKSNLKQHIGAVHEGKKPFKCDLYDSCYKTRLGQNLHISSIHERFEWAKCDASFTQNEHLNIHNKTVNEEYNPLICNASDA